jgi:hypothetical protein
LDDGNTVTKINDRFLEIVQTHNFFGHEDLSKRLGAAHAIAYGVQKVAGLSCKTRLPSHMLFTRLLTPHAAEVLKRHVFVGDRRTAA